MFERLDAIVNKYNELQKNLTDPEIMSDYNKIKVLSKESSDLEETVKKYEEYKNTLNEIEDEKILIKDEELREVAKMKTMEKILSWKLEEQPEETKQIFLLVIYTVCILIMLRKMVGKLKNYML